jgi:aromatic ring-cleaving dioxygenase
MDYHAHIYYHPDQQEFAERLQISIKFALGDCLKKISDLIPHAHGPHPIPTFEIHYDQAHYNHVLGYLKEHHGDLSVLIHQDTGDDVPDHSENILWLGEPVALDFEFFEKIKTHPELRINK